MPKVSPLQGDFSGGEVSPLVQGRVDSDRYKQSVDYCLNYIPTVQGGLTRRPATKFVAEVKDSSKTTRLIPFEFSLIQAYILEFGDLYIRFYKDNGQILSAPLTPYEIVSPWTSAQVNDLRFVQNADTIYVVHPEVAPQKITRTSDTSWSITPLDFLDGPYESLMPHTYTITPSATTGTITLTASAGTPFNNVAVGQLIRLKIGSTWGWVKVTINPLTGTTLTALVRGTLGGVTPSTDFRYGIWYVNDNIEPTFFSYPSTVTFHEDRLFFGGYQSFPQRVDGSRTSDYENFAPTDPDGVVIATHALSFTLNSTDVNVIKWISSDEKGLAIGTVANEWIIRPSTFQEALSPTNVTGKPATSYGSFAAAPVRVGKSTLFIQRTARKVREFNYFYDVDGFKAPDLTLLSENITIGGLTQITLQKEPQQLIWGVKNDGTLTGLTYERDSDTLKVAWHRHQIGGVSDTAGTNARVESIAVIPSPTIIRYDLWMIVQRRINGATKRYVEYMTKFFEEGDNQRDAFFVDCGLTYDVPKTITNITQANPAVVTSTAHGFANGDAVLISGVSGMTEVNTQTFTVANVAANTFELLGINSAGYHSYVSGGQVRKYVTTITGLDHLEGQSVSILADGATQPSRTVASGSITLQERATTVQVGLGYNSDVRLLRFEAGSQDGTALGKTRRIHRVGFLLYKSLGFKFGSSFSSLNDYSFRRASDPISRAVPLFSGIISDVVEFDYDFENQICFRQDKPLPSTVLAVMPQMVTQDRG